VVVVVQPPISLTLRFPARYTSNIPKGALVKNL
jgi:hypothetical protein